MKYLCLIYVEETALHAASPAALAAIGEACLDYSAELRDQGRMIASAKLQPVQSATTLRIHQGRLAVSDGPFAETKEQLGGFYLIEARDLNDAIRVASRIPPARFGCIEVRPLTE